MNFDQTKFAAIVAQAKLAAANSPAWTRAIEKAAAAIIAGEINVHIFDGFALVVNKGGEVYKVNGHCECKAGQSGMACYHRAAARLVEMMEAAPATKRQPAITRSAGWYGVRSGDAMWLHGWMI
jgi:hypothetical protein